MSLRLEQQIKMLREDKQQIISEIAEELKGKTGIDKETVNYYLNMKINLKYLHEEISELIKLNEEVGQLITLKQPFLNIYKIIYIEILNNNIKIELKNINTNDSEDEEFEPESCSLYYSIQELLETYDLDVNHKYFVDSNLYAIETPEDTYLAGCSKQYLQTKNVEFIKLN